MERTSEKHAVCAPRRNRQVDLEECQDVPRRREDAVHNMEKRSYEVKRSVAEGTARRAILDSSHNEHITGPLKGSTPRR